MARCARLLVTLLLVSGVCLVEAGFAPQDACANATTQAAMNECAAKNLAKADADLNATYQQILQRLKDDPSKRKLLIAAERAWVAFRDGECNFSSSGSIGGSVYPMLVTQCKAGLTKTRVDQLKQYLQCPEGDLSCPVPAK